MSDQHRRARRRGKDFERKVAKDLGTERTGPTGKNDADVKHDLFGIECKSMAKLSLRKDHVEQAKRNAKDRKWILCLKEVGSSDILAVMPYKQMLEYIELVERNENGRV